ncbi:MAG: acylphosphatase [Bacteroidetes bacterium]|nr:acylphosphatase [Bacteroidota bacterium]
MTKIIHKDISVSGEFRWSCGFRFAAMQKAYALGITGYVTRKKSTIYIEAEGEMKKLETFIAWCHIGPVGCRIDSVLAEDGEMKGYTSFEMK